LWEVISARGIDLGRITAKPESERSLRTPIMVDGMEATDHEAQTSFQKKTQHDQICSAFTGFGI
jgi:hypothetical protein